MKKLFCWFLTSGESRASRRTFVILISSVLLLGLSPRVGAQWLTQSIALTNGWNAVYLHVDPSYDTLEHQVAMDANNPIQEIWLWKPTLSSMQFITSPQQPVNSSEWAVWLRSSGSGTSLYKLIGNAAYLVRVQTNASPYKYTWNVKGKPVPPNYQWTTTGLNFLGFPTVPAGPPNFTTFLSPSPELSQSPEIYQYPGGELGASNPVRVFTLNTTLVERGRAYWISSGQAFNHYFAPFELRAGKTTGMSFGAELSVLTFWLHNVTASNLTVTLQLLPSEASPTGQTPILGVPPLIARGPMNMTNLTYTYTNLTTGNVYSLVLPAGSQIEVYLGLDRSAMPTTPGQFYAGILRFKDSLGYSQVDVGASATSGSSAGLWVGAAVISEVGQYLKSYQRDDKGNPIMDTNQAYVVTGINTNLGSVVSYYPLRLILHNPEANNAVLLQRVYYGMGAATNPIVATSESALNPNYLSQARRISATHLPWNETNTGWVFSGQLAQNANISTTVDLGYNDHASNPFLHTYHPDHDNLDVDFASVLPQGHESYKVRREIRLNTIPPSDDFNSRTSAGQILSGTYGETITVLGLARGATNDARSFEVRGSFSLNRISSTSNLVTAP